MRSEKVLRHESQLMEESKSEKYVLPAIDSNSVKLKSNSCESEAPSSLLSKSSYSMSNSQESRQSFSDSS